MDIPTQQQFINPSANVVVVDPRWQDYEKLVATSHTPELHFHFFGNGDKAIRNTMTTKCDLWLVNMHLSDMSGIELMALVRQRDPQSTVFLVSNSQNQQDEIAARAAGPTAYVCKPPHSVWLSSVCSTVQEATPTGGITNKPVLIPSTANY